MSNFLEQILNTKVNQLESDAARWAYVRDHLAEQLPGINDGTFAFNIRFPQGRAATFTELIDRLRAGETA